METNKQIKSIIEKAIPLTMDCEIKRSDELKRRAKLRIEIEELLATRDTSQPFQPNMEYKGQGRDEGREPSTPPMIELK